MTELQRACRIQADCETDLCHSLVEWLNSTGEKRKFARWAVVRAVLATKMARGAVASQRMELYRG